MDTKALQGLNIPAREPEYYISGIRENNGHVLRELYATYSHSVTQLVLQNNGTVEQAKDVFQDVLISIYTQSKKKEIVLSCSFTHYFLLACKRRWLNVLNSKYENRTDELTDSSDGIMTINEDVNSLFEYEDKLAFLQNKLRMLDVQCREMIELSLKVHEDGRFIKLDDIAKELELSYGYVRKRIAECKQRLINLVKSDTNFWQYL
jgi:RNA polymerase sigma factor (sigma-70 family)